MPRLMILLLVLSGLTLPRLVWPDGYMIRRESEVPVFWTDADGEPDCGNDADVVMWSRTDSGATGNWTLCHLESDVIDPGTGKFFPDLLPYPEPFTTIPPVAGCLGTNHLGIDLAQTGLKYRLTACGGGAGTNFQTEPYLAKFDQLGNGVAAVTCSNGEDCTLHVPSTPGLASAVSESGPVKTLTLTPATPNIFSCAQNGIVCTSAGTGGGTQYTGMTGCNLQTAAGELHTRFPVPRAGTVSNLVTKFSAAVTSGQTVSVALQKNGAPTSLTTSHTNADSTNVKQDTTNTFTVVAGDTLNVRLICSGGTVAQPGWLTIGVTYR
jgi:hypothetical protein